MTQAVPLIDDCFIRGQTPTTDNLLNVHFEGSLNDCAFHCRHYEFCRGFSYNIEAKTCYPKARFSYDKVATISSSGWISGPKHLCGIILFFFFFFMSTTSKSQLKGIRIHKRFILYKLHKISKIPKSSQSYFSVIFYSNITLQGTQSFTSLKADLCQDRTGFVFSTLCKISFKKVLTLSHYEYVS